MGSVAPANSAISVRRLTTDEMRGRSGVTAAPPAKLNFTEVEPEAHGGGAFSEVGYIDLLTVPERNYLAVETTGSPRTSEDFSAAAESLYAAAYAVKVRNKALARRAVPGADGERRSDFSMPPLERIRAAVTAHTTDDVRWTLLLRRPAWIDDAEVGDALDGLEESKGYRALSRIRCVQHPAATFLQTRVDGRWSAALTPTAKAFDVQLRERGLTADPREDRWHEVCLGEPGAPSGQSEYLLRLRLTP